MFAVHGCVTGSFAARIPWIASHVGVGVGHLGIALLMPGIGALLAMPFSGRLAHRFALRPFVTATIVAWCACLVLPALPTSLVTLCAVLLVFGAVAGLADMAMNAEGVLVEKLFGRSVMSSLHGFWSVGVLVGSAVSALASHAGIDTRVQFAVEALVLAAVGAAVAQLLIEDPTTSDGSCERPGREQHRKNGKCLGAKLGATGWPPHDSVEESEFRVSPSVYEGEFWPSRCGRSQAMTVLALNVIKLHRFVTRSWMGCPRRGGRRGALRPRSGRGRSGAGARVCVAAAGS